MRKSMGKKSTPEIVEQQVLTHHAKTVYFNGLWKSFITKAAAMIGGIAVFTMGRLYTENNSSLHFGMVFEFLSIITAVFTIFFLHRAFSPLLAFKAAFAFALLQVGWFGHNFYNKYNFNINGDLKHNQLPLGAICFFVTWASDRYMLRSEGLAEATSKEVQSIKKKTN